MAIYITGDVHGDAINRFSYRKHPQLRELTTQDIVIVLGDWGIPWNKHTQEQDKYTIKFLNEKPWTTIALRGNHDNTDALRAMPQEEKYGGKMRRLVIDDVTADRTFIIDEPTILTLEGNRCLCIPGADSHDVWPIRNSFTGLNVVDKENDPNWKSQVKNFKQRGLFYRVKGESWWPDEGVNIDLCDRLLDNEAGHFDFIFTHESPAFISRELGFAPTIGEAYLEIMRKHTDFDAWFYGHLHRNCWSIAQDDRLMCLYQSIIQVV